MQKVEFALKINFAKNPYLIISRDGSTLIRSYIIVPFKKTIIVCDE